MPTKAQNPTNKRYTRRLGLCDCGAKAITMKHGESVCRRCDAIERILYPRRNDRKFLQAKRYAA